MNEIETIIKAKVEAYRQTQLEVFTLLDIEQSKRDNPTAYARESSKIPSNP